MIICLDSDFKCHTAKNGADREIAADRDKLSGVVEQLKVLTAEGLPTTLTKWAALGAKLLKILAEAVIE